MNHIRKYFFSALLLVSVPCFVNGQGRILQLLEVNPDARSAAMGGQFLMGADHNYLYVNPTSLLYKEDARYSIDVNGQLYPKQEGADGTLWYGNASAGWRFLSRHAAYAGFRYQGGLSIPTVSDQFGTPGKPIKPFDWAIDLGYSFKLSSALSVFATGSLVQSWIGEGGYAGLFSVGGNYRQALNLGLVPSLLNVAVRVTDFGTPIYYKSKGYALPSNAQAGADLSMEMAPEHSITVALGGRYVFFPDNARLLQGGAGAEYSFRRMLSARAGFQFGEHKSSHATFGLGCKFAGIRLDAAYLVSTANETGVNTLLLSLGYQF
ncbi:MAG: PorV/PorQ family protein [Bacteroidales bacterium]|nr:PorV/PorQ family protein [Bacteroidales bacterium]MDY6001871.1 PorV/PorQ family protein [Candidatus Cryptobacteroides sp.]